MAKQIHKFNKGDGVELFMITDSAKKPTGKNITIPSSSWEGRGIGSGRSNAISYLEALKFTREKPEEEKEEGTKGKKKSSVSEFVREIAQGLK